MFEEKITVNKKWVSLVVLKWSSLNKYIKINNLTCDLTE
jgi:hypothetical protein